MLIYFPTTIDEIFNCLKKSTDAVIWAGGTDLMVNIRNGLIKQPEALIFLENIPKLKEIYEENDYIIIGTAATHTVISNNPIIQNKCLVLKKSIEVLGSPLIRNMGTIGGNICTASPAGDTLPPLFLLDAEIVLKDRETTRTIAINKFFKGPKQTVMRKGELLTEIKIKKPKEGAMQHYEKVGQRKALSIAIVSLAALIEKNSDGIIEKARFAWGSVAPTVVSFPEVDKFFEGKKLSSEIIKEAADMVKNMVLPISDIRADSEYRKEVAGNLLLRLDA